MTARQAQGDETRTRLLYWTGGQKGSERLAAHILAADGFRSVDPSQPLGGPDGLRDATCLKGEFLWVAAVYFPNGPRRFTAMRSKFEKDAQGVMANHAGGFAFVTNQHLTVTQREALRAVAPTDQVEVYHLERIVHILDSPANYGTRLEFLGIEMTKEEQLAYFATVAGPNSVEWQRFRTELLDEVRRLIVSALPASRP